MRAVVQRALRASVFLKEKNERREIGPGLLVLLGIGHGDTTADAEYLAEKLVGLRIFEDEDGKMNRALSDIPGGAVLIVSQFTLYGDARKGRRPGRRRRRWRRSPRTRCPSPARAGRWGRTC